MIIAAALDLINEKQRLEAIALIESQESAEAVAASYSELLKSLYWNNRSCADFVFYGKAAVAYCLKKSLELQTRDVEFSRSMKVWAKALACEVATNTWPGWQDPGVVIAEEDREEGLNMAKLYLNLMLELQNPLEKLGSAHWLIGAHLLAKGEHELATGAFKVAKELSFEARSYSLLFERLSAANLANYTNQVCDILCTLIKRESPRPGPSWC